MEKKYKTAKKRYKDSTNIKNKYKKRRTKKNIRKITKSKKYGGKCKDVDRCTTIYSKVIKINDPYKTMKQINDNSNNDLTYLMYSNSENADNLKNVDELFYLLKEYSNNKTIPDTNTESYQVSLKGMTKTDETRKDKNTDEILLGLNNITDDTIRRDIVRENNRLLSEYTVKKIEETNTKIENDKKIEKDKIELGKMKKENQEKEKREAEQTQNEDPGMLKALRKLQEEGKLKEEQYKQEQRNSKYFN